MEEGSLDGYKTGRKGLNSVYRVGESEGGLFRYMGQLTMDTLAPKVTRINFHVNSLGVSIDL